ncbi:Receptor-like protein 19 [Bienertia sinuspersici]
MKTFKQNYLIHILLLILASSILFISTTSACNAIDKEALLEFKSKIEYDSSGQLKTWDPKTDCCTSWNNVKCDNKTGRVVKLSPFRPSNPMDLDISIFVNGTLSPFLGNLTSLQELDLAHFQQYYLDSPGQLSQLTYLSIAQNILTGSIPTSLANLHKLQTFNPSYNRLSGTIPSSLFQSMKSLKNLYLQQNKFTGLIPSSIGKLVSLESLELNNNSFSGEIPSSIVKLVSLDTLYLHDNSFSGEIPTTIGTLKKLNYINLSSNKFTGKIPNSLGQLSKLYVLNLENNKLSGSIPANVLNLKSLVNIDVSMNQLSGKIPPHKSDFPASSFMGNPGLCDAPLPPCKSS